MQGSRKIAGESSRKITDAAKRQVVTIKISVRTWTCMGDCSRTLGRRQPGQAGRNQLYKIDERKKKPVWHWQSMIVERKFPTRRLPTPNGECAKNRASERFHFYSNKPFAPYFWTAGVQVRTCWVSTHDYTQAGQRDALARLDARFLCAGLRFIPLHTPQYCNSLAQTKK